MSAMRIVDITDEPSFGLIPPCVDPGFDHRSCDYWENADHGSKAARLAWLEKAPAAPPRRPSQAGNPFVRADAEPQVNPFAPAGRSVPAFNAFADGDDDPVFNPFAPSPARRPTVAPDAPRKVGLLGRGLAVFGSYAKVLLVDEVALAYVQFGPLSAYPRAQRLRDLYPQLPAAPLPAVVTCIATTAEARGGGHATTLVRAVCDDLAGRGFAAVEAYPERDTRPDATSAATPGFWLAAGFRLAVEDERYPVLRRELA